MPENSIDFSQGAGPPPRRRQVVGSAAELTPGQRKIVCCGGREIGLFNVNGEFFGLQNRCPHQGGPLCRGRLRPLVVADGVYHVAYEREQEIVKCPWHQWEFDVKTGTAICDPRLRVKTYRVAEENGELVVYW